MATKKAEKEMSPLEKARAARAAGGGKSKGKKKKAKGVVFKAPEGTKSFFVKMLVKFDKDGILGDMKATRVKGNIGNENAKTVDLLLNDPETSRKLLSRYAAGVFIKNEAKRIAPLSAASLILRVSVTKDSEIKTSFKEIKFKEGKEGKLKLLPKKHFTYRALRKPARMLAGAFTKIAEFPSNKELKDMEASE